MSAITGAYQALRAGNASQYAIPPGTPPQVAAVVQSILGLDNGSGHPAPTQPHVGAPDSSVVGIQGDPGLGLGPSGPVTGTSGHPGAVSPNPMLQGGSVLGTSGHPGLPGPLAHPTAVNPHLAAGPQGNTPVPNLRALQLARALAGGRFGT